MSLSNIKKRIKRNISQKLGLMGGIGGSGGGSKGGGKSSGRSEAVLRPPNAADIKQTVAVAGALDLLCEGPIGGAVNPRGLYLDGDSSSILQSVYLNDVPVLEMSENVSYKKDFLNSSFLLHTSHSGSTFNMRDTSRYDIQFYSTGDGFLEYFVKNVNINKDLVPMGALANTIFCFVGKPPDVKLLAGSKSISRIPVSMFGYYKAANFTRLGRRAGNYEVESVANSNNYSYNNTCCLLEGPKDYYTAPRFFTKQARRGFSINFHAEAEIEGLADFSNNRTNDNFIWNSLFLQQANQRTTSGAQYQNSSYNISGDLPEPANLNACIVNYTGNAPGVNSAIYDSKQLFDRSSYNFGQYNSQITNVPVLRISRKKPDNLFIHDMAIDPIRATLNPGGYYDMSVWVSTFTNTTHFGFTFSSWTNFEEVGQDYLYSSLALRRCGLNVNHSSPYNQTLNWLDLSDIRYGPCPTIFSDRIHRDFQYPRISGNRLRWYDQPSMKLGGASSRETTPLMIEGMHQNQNKLNGYYLRSGGYIDYDNIYSDRKIRNLTSASNPYERETRFVNRFHSGAYIETGITPNNTTGWILKWNGYNFYYLDHCIQKKFNYNGEQGYDLYSPQQFLRKRWTGSLEFTDSTALSLTGSPEFTQFQNDNAEDFSGGWVSYWPQYKAGNIVSILGTGYGDWKCFSTGEEVFVHFDDNSGISLDSKVTRHDESPLNAEDTYRINDRRWVGGVGGHYTPTRLDIEGITLRDYLSMECLVSGEIKYVMADADLDCILNQNPAFYNGARSNNTRQLYGSYQTASPSDRIIDLFAPLVEQTCYSKQQNIRYGNAYVTRNAVHLRAEGELKYRNDKAGSINGRLDRKKYNIDYHLKPKFIKNGIMPRNSNGDVSFLTRDADDRRYELLFQRYDGLKEYNEFMVWNKQYAYDLNLNMGSSFSDTIDATKEYESPFEHPAIFGNIKNLPNSNTKYVYKHNMFQKLDGITDASIAGEISLRDLYDFSQTAYNFTDIYAEFKKGEELQTKMLGFSESKTENKVVSELFGPFRSGGNAQDGNGNEDVRVVYYSDVNSVNYSNWTNQMPIEEEAISYTYIVDRSEVTKVECIVEILAMQDTNHHQNQILPSSIDFRIEVGFHGLRKTNTLDTSVQGLVDPSSPFITNLATVILPKYSEIHEAHREGKSLSYLKANHKRYVKVIKRTHETESILLSRQVRTRAFNEIIDSNFTYPNSALAGIYFDSKSFTDPPKRTYDLRLKKCKIPSNYFPLVTGGVYEGLDKRFLDKESDEKQLIYSGDWDGSFREDWTDNPAWILYDILTNNSYGLGDYQDDVQDIDIFKLYQIGKYCDAVDSNGYFSGLSTNAGGLEPRHSCNILFEESFNGFDFVNAVCNMFHGVAYWKNGSLNFFADKPEDISATFNNSNVFDGVFSYSDMSKNNRFNFVEIEYKDKTDNFKTKVEYVEDEEDIRKKGILKYKEGARGITSRSQARRYAKHILYSNKLETEGVQFQASQQSIIIEPGDIIQINDELKSFQRDSARLLEVDTLNNSIKIENTINTGAIATGEGVYILTPTSQTSLNDLYTRIDFHDLSITDSVLSAYETPQIINVDITGINQGANHIELLLNENHEDIYRLGQAKLGQMCNVRITGTPENLYRVMSIIPNENNLYEIVAKEYNPVKYKIIEEGEGLENNEYYNLPHIGLPANIIKRPPEPQGFSFSTGENNMYSINLSGTITGEVGGIEEKYRVSVTKPNGMYFFQEFEKDSTLSPPQTYFEFKNLIGVGTYKVEVTSILNPESSKTLKQTFVKKPKDFVYESPFLESVKINGKRYNEISNISSVNNFGKDILIDLNYVNNYGLPYENKNHIKMNLLQGSTGHSFDIPELPVSITKDERDQIFGSAERTFTIQSYLEDSNGNVYPSPEININHSTPKINSVQTLSNSYNLRINVETENFKNLEKISIYSGSDQDFEIGPESFLVTKPFYPQLNNEVEFGHQTTGKVYYKLIPYDCFGSGVLHTGFSEQINFPEPEVSDSYVKNIYNTIFLSDTNKINDQFLFTQTFNIPQKDLILKIGGTPTQEDCVVDLFLGQFSGRFMIEFNNNSYSNNIYFCSNPFIENETNLLKFSSNLVDNNSVSGKLVSGDLPNLDLEIKAQ